ncbi:hypothetical protein [Actinomadura monticuli]|uniref:ATPase n=1 Tax=Actinomadura monticuli TaxID=3097367 RepID=A0ABV4QIH7_9ACTN
MPTTIRDFLERFRPAGAPGAAAVAVPSDRRSALAAELEPVFALLADAEVEQRRMVEEARRRACAVRDAAREQATGLVNEARGRAAAERAAVSAAVQRTGTQERQALMAAASEEAARIEAGVSERTPLLVEKALRSIEVMLGDDMLGDEATPTGGGGTS